MPTPNSNEQDVIIAPSSEEGGGSGEGDNKPGENQDGDTDENQDADKNQSKPSGGNKPKTEEEMTDEEREAQKANEDFILNFKDEDMEDDDQRAQLAEALKNARTTVHQKRHYRQKLADYEKKNVTVATLAQKPSEVKGTSKSQEVDNSRELVIELRQDNPWMTKEVAQKIVKQAKVNNETIAKTVQDPMVMDWLKKEKAKVQAQDASVAPEQKGAPSGGDGIADRDWSNASFDETLKQHQKMMNK